MLQYLYSWPDQLPSAQRCTDPLLKIEVLLRVQDYCQAEALLATSLASLLNQVRDSNCTKYYHVQVLYFFLNSFQGKTDTSSIIFNKLTACTDFPLDSDILNFIHLRHFLDIKDQSLPNLVSSLINKFHSNSLPFSLLFIEYFLLSGNFEKAKTLIDTTPPKWKDTLEFLLLKCHHLELLQRWDLILEILIQSAQRFPSHVQVWAYLLVATVEAKSHEHAIPLLRKAIALHGDNPLFFSHYCRISLLKSRNADARRYSLKDRLSKLTSNPSHNPFLTNLWVTQDRLGYSEWINYLYFNDNCFTQLPLAMLEPLLLQNASINGSTQLSEEIISPILSQYSSLPITPYNSNNSSISSAKHLRIAWVSSDICHHPVARFLLGYFSSIDQCSHHHYLIDVNDCGTESFRSLFDDLPTIDVHNYGSLTLPDRVNKIRDLQPHVTIDLNGWTGGHLMNGFYHRLSPLQVNYLGYFASTGLPSMDYWIGDDNLFPQPYSHWHTESLCRLNRCFIAWQPPECLVESRIPVVDSINKGPIHFGSFNHNRKLSNATLKLWSKILHSIPHSRLVLKASNQDDASTQELLRRRMLRNNIDPDSIIWLPRTETHEEHLRQYAHIDVSLDCFPNGGCTTTCESLWMGAPVITLIGTSYVSRMSTAVLFGAGLQSWCMQTPDEYLSFAIHQNDHLHWLRSNRSHWRNVVRSSQLGDAASLMNSLENCFSDLFASSQ